MVTVGRVAVKRLSPVDVVVPRSLAFGASNPTTASMETSLHLGLVIFSPRYLGGKVELHVGIVFMKRLISPDTVADEGAEAALRQMKTTPDSAAESETPALVELLGK